MRRRTFLKAAAIGVGAGGVEAKGQAAPLGPPEQLAIRVGPYLQNPAADGMTVMWMTNVPCHAWVEYGPTEALGLRAEGEADGLRQANVALHRVRLTGLGAG